MNNNGDSKKKEMVYKKIVVTRFNTGENITLDTKKKM